MMAGHVTGEMTKLDIKFTNRMDSFDENNTEVLKLLQKKFDHLDLTIQDHDKKLNYLNQQEVKHDNKTKMIVEDQIRLKNMVEEQEEKIMWLINELKVVRNGGGT